MITPAVLVMSADILWRHIIIMIIKYYEVDMKFVQDNQSSSKKEY